MEDNVIKDIRYAKSIRNLFRLKNEKRAMQNRKIRDIRNHFEHEEKEEYCKPVREFNFWNNNYV